MKYVKYESHYLRKEQTIFKYSGAARKECISMSEENNNGYTFWTEQATGSQPSSDSKTTAPAMESMGQNQSGTQSSHPYPAEQATAAVPNPAQNISASTVPVSQNTVPTGAETFNASQNTVSSDTGAFNTSQTIVAQANPEAASNSAQFRTGTTPHYSTAGSENRDINRSSSEHSSSTNANAIPAQTTQTTGGSQQAAHSNPASADYTTVQNTYSNMYSEPAGASFGTQQEYFNSTRYNNGAIPPEPKAKKKRKGPKKILGLIASAAVFGLIAGGFFIGFNKIYYHFNPDALPSSQSGSANPGNNSLLIPNEKNTLPLTTVAQNVSITNTDVSPIVKKNLPAAVAITSKFITNNYFYGQYTQEGGGSGIIIGENDNEYLIATNNHVVEGASEITITFIDETSAKAYIKGTDPSADLAVIAVKKSDLSASTKENIIVATLGNSDEVEVGHMVIAIGNALGNGQSTTVGWISAKDRQITNSETGTTLTVLQTDAAINPGNSGGALLNMKGEVIGINSAKLAGTKIEGIGYAIPISKALPIVNDLMTREVLTDDEKGYLGIQLSDVDITAEIASAYNWPMGVYIKEVYPDSAAEKGGLLSGDIITAVNGSSITTRAQLQKTINSYRHGTTVTITYSRFENGAYEEHTTEVVLSPSSVLTTTPTNDSSGTDNSTTPQDDSQNNSGGNRRPEGNTTPEIPNSSDDQIPDESSPKDNGRNSIEDFFEDFFGNSFGF